MISDNLKRIRDKISAICGRCGKNFSEIVLVGVTKYANPSQIKEMVEAGVTHIGENRIQEAQEKFAQLGGALAGVTKHMIGHLQTNKVKYAVELFDLIQSVDSLKLIEEIEKQAQKRKKVVDILLEVKTSREEQKTGIDPSQTMDLIKAVGPCSHIRLLGLMTMAAHGEDSEIVRNCFRQLKNLFKEVKKTFAHLPNVEMKYLSMGMSDDYEIAIEEGSNMVRIGRAIFSGE